MTKEATLSGRPANLAVTILTNSILAGRFKPGEYLPPLRELSRRHGLSSETFRRALKAMEGEQVVVSEPRHGFRVVNQPSLRVSESDMSGTCLFLGPPGDEEEWSEMHRTMLVEMQRLAARKGFALLTVGSSQKPTAELVERIHGARTSGAVLERRNPAFEDMLRKAGIPAVLIESASLGMPMDSVVQDGYSAGKEAVSHLVSQGHKRIAWVGPALKQAEAHIVERYAGFTGGMAEHGLPLVSDTLIETPYRDVAAARVRVRAALDVKSRPTAIVALWAHITASVAQAAGDLGLSFGQDLDIVGWSTEEAYASGFLRNFSNGSVPPAMVWSVREMVELAYARLEARCARPGLPYSATRVPMRMRMAES